MRQWTDHQLDAITARGGSVIVSAAAALRFRRAAFLFASALPLGALMISLALIKPAVLPQ